MDIDRNTLARTYSEKSNDELLSLHAEGTLTDIAYEILEMELAERGISVPARTNPVPTGGPVGIGGWLLLFCLSLTVFSPLITIVLLAASYEEVSSLFEEFPGLLTITILDMVLSIGIMCFSIYAGVRLWRKQQSAVQTAKRYLIVFLLCTVFGSFLPFMAGLPI